MDPFALTGTILQIVFIAGAIVLGPLVVLHAWQTWHSGPRADVETMEEWAAARDALRR